MAKTKLKVSEYNPGDPPGAIEFEATVKAWFAWDNTVLTLDFSQGDDWHLFVRVPNAKHDDGGPGEYELFGNLGELRKRIRKAEGLELARVSGYRLEASVV